MASIGVNSSGSDPMTNVSQERDEDSGQYREEFADSDFLTAIAELETATTNGIADFVGCSYDLAYRRLNELEDEGKVQSKEVGGSFLWINQ